MHSVRRAALRATLSSSSRAVALPRQQIALAARHLTKANASPVAVLPLTRYFSQTPSARDEEDVPASPAGVNEVNSSTTQPGISDGTGIFVSNMTFDATDVHMREAFSKYGEILSTSIGRDGRGLSRGFGFITFTTKEAADRAVKEANSSFWHGRRIVVQPRAQKESSEVTGRHRNSAREPSNSLYIGNIPYETSDADLNKLFRTLENVRDVRVAVDRNTGWPRGFAHADFADVDSAVKAHEQLSQTQIGGRQLRVDFSTPKSATSNSITSDKQ
ncbi:RNA-binding domain-containing protein [Xylariaceae sp. FL1272]|nr:RNA-binding domain-containing protein [Xylariaceae sp. FL1272]